MGQAKLIRRMYDYPAGTEGVYTDIYQDNDHRYYFVPEGSAVGWKVDVGTDIKLIDWQPHLYDGHDDVISACYWADRMLSNRYPKRVYRTHQGKYAIRSCTRETDTVLSSEHAEVTDLIVKHSGGLEYGWQIAACWQPRLGRSRHISWEHWDFWLQADNRELGAEGDDDSYVLIQNDIDYILTEHLVLNQIQTYYPSENINSVIVKMGEGDYDEIWITDDSHAYEIGTSYRRVK